MINANYNYCTNHLLIHAHLSINCVKIKKRHNVTFEINPVRIFKCRYYPSKCVINQ